MPKLSKIYNKNIVQCFTIIDLKNISMSTFNSDVRAWFKKFAKIGQDHFSE